MKSRSTVEYNGSTITSGAMMATSRAQRTRDRRFQLRASAADEELIKVAAERQCLNVTEFILRSAREKAEEVLADQARFALNESQWKQFLTALDREPRDKPRLQRLFEESHIATRGE